MVEFRVVVPDDAWEVVDRVCREHGRTSSQVVTNALRLLGAVADVCDDGVEPVSGVESRG